MKDYKVFISHNSVQKTFVEKLSALIGRDYAYVDKYNFQGGNDLADEIEKHIGNSTVFVLLLSDEALESDWVRREVATARVMLIDGVLKVFIPVIIDSSITQDDSRLENEEYKLKWIKKYLLKNISSEQLVARIIRRHLIEISWKDNPKLKERAKLFVGRDKDINDLQFQLYENISNEKRAVIVSGLPHVGRKRLLSKFIESMDNVHIFYEPIRVILTESDDLVSFVQQLNEIVNLYDNSSLLMLLKDKKECMSLAVRMLNMIAELQEKVFIRDEKCIVLSNGRLSDWFVDLLKHKSLVPIIHFFIASQCTPKSSVEKNFHEIISRQVSALDRTSMKILFNAYAKITNISPSEDDISFLLEKLNGCPQQVYDIVDIIKKHNLHEAKKQLPNVIDMFSGNMVAIINELAKTPHAKDILIMFSKFEFVTYDLLQEVCPYDIKDAFEIFDSYALYESFGMANEYLRLSPVMINYISRSKLDLPPDYTIKFREVTKKKLEELDSDLTDLSTQLLAVKELLRDPQAKAKEKYLIPHYVLKVIVEEYNKKNDTNVILLVEKLLNDRVGASYDEINRSIRYWYCCSLCRLKDSKFLTAVSFFEDSDYSYNFLNGFYERHQGHYETAEEYYKKALEQSGGSGDREYRSKTEHELVLVMMSQGHYGEALPLAEKNYNQDKDNSYQIEAFFRCLVKSPHPDKDLLKELIQRMESSYTKNKRAMLVSMKAEYAFYVQQDFTNSVNMLRDFLMIESYDYAERTLREICQRRESMSVYGSIMKKIKEEKYRSGGGSPM